MVAHRREVCRAKWSCGRVKRTGSRSTRIRPAMTNSRSCNRSSAWWGLEAVDLSGCARVTDAGVMHLAHLRGLKALGLADTQVTDSGVTLLLTRFPRSGGADAERRGVGIGKRVVPHLIRMRKLKWLALPPVADTAERGALHSRSAVRRAS